MVSSTPQTLYCGDKLLSRPQDNTITILVCAALSVDALLCGPLNPAWSLVWKLLYTRGSDSINAEICVMK
jgi:hypothetical protein